MEKRVWPQDISNSDDYLAMEKKIFSSFKNKISEGWLIVHIDPIGMSNETVKMGLFISDKALITFSVQDCVDEGLFLQNSQIYTKMVHDKIYSLLCESSMLINRSGDKKFLKFPYRHINILKLEKKVSGENSKIIFENIFKDEKTLEAIEEDLLNEYEYEGLTEIDDQMAISIIGKLAPEYTVTKPEVVKVDTDEVNFDDVDIEELPDITGKEIEYSTFLLDEEQVKFVNEMGTGHRVLLANAGAGKSVLVLSRAYRYASAHKNQKVLITCYNNNLCDAYRFKNSCANFGDNKNVYILTFHRLVKKIYEECLHHSISGEYPTEAEIQDLLLYLNRGMVKLEFSAIFIDEVQIFQPVYLDICYSLLSKNKDALFLLAGDLNQTVRNQSRRGDAPWKKINNGRLNFSGRVKYISKNYRNSPQISAYLNGMLLYMNDQLAKCGLINKDEFDYDVFGTGPSKNVALSVQTNISRMDITKKTMEALDEIVKKYKVSYSDIAILYPVSQHRLLNYYIYLWITSELNKCGIEYSLIYGNNDDGTRKTYSNTRGVVISTIDSSLGLDFKAVIMVGLFPFSYVYTEGTKVKPVKVKSWEQLKTMSSDDQEKVKIQLRKIYTGCSRAREILYVLSDIDSGSPFSDILEDRSK